eukprot:1187358-Prorocentrum_minimum.AAC.3
MDQNKWVTTKTLGSPVRLRTVRAVRSTVSRCESSSTVEEALLFTAGGLGALCRLGVFDAACIRRSVRNATHAHRGRLLPRARSRRLRRTSSLRVSRSARIANAVGGDALLEHFTGKELLIKRSRRVAKYCRFMEHYVQ